MSLRRVPCFILLVCLTVPCVGQEPINRATLLKALERTKAYEIQILRRYMQPSMVGGRRVNAPRADIERAQKGIDQIRNNRGIYIPTLRSEMVRPGTAGKLVGKFAVVTTTDDGVPIVEMRSFLGGFEIMPLAKTPLDTRSKERDPGPIKLALFGIEANQKPRVEFEVNALVIFGKQYHAAIGPVIEVHRFSMRDLEPEKPKKE